MRAFSVHLRSFAYICFYVRIYVFTHMRVYIIILNCMRVSPTFAHAVTCVLVKSMYTYVRIHVSTLECAPLIKCLDAFGHSKPRKHRRIFSARTFRMYYIYMYNRPFVPYINKVSSYTTGLLMLFIYYWRLFVCTLLKICR